MTLPDILGRDVVLEIHPCPLAKSRNLPERSCSKALVRCLRWRARRPLGTEIPGNSDSRSVTFPYCRCKRHGPVRCTRHAHARRQLAAWDKADDIGVPDRTAAMMTGEMHVWRPSARHGQAIGLDAPAVTEAHRADATAPDRVHHEVALAGIDDGCDLDALLAQVLGGAKAVVVVREHRDLSARRDTKSVDISAHGTRQHDTGTVVVAKGH